MRIVVLHPNNKIATTMTEEEGGGASAMMVAADDNGGCGGRGLSRRHWRLEVVLPSSTLLPSCNDGGLRGMLKPGMRHVNAVVDTVALASCMAAGATLSRARKKKVEAETMTTTTTRTAWKTPAPAISHCQGGFNNQKGREAEQKVVG